MSLDRRSIGIIEDDPIMGESLVQRLALEGAEVTWWRTKAEAVTGLARRRHHAVICDLKLPDGAGEDIFLEAVKSEGAPPFLFMTAFGEIDQAVRLMRCGAGDYVTKPFDMTSFLERLETLVDPFEGDGQGVLGVSPAIRAVERTLLRLATVSAPVLLTGETGSGKEVCARLLHASRGHGAGPFMAVNCAAIPAELMESELFGHEKGAFTGAQGRHAGYAERAGTGTLFLDEIGDLAPRLQAKLLRLLEDRTFTRVGGEQALPFKARIVCATNADLIAKVKAGSFREDLLYRINVVNVPLPPLRDRSDDIVWLIDRFFSEFEEQSGDRIHGMSALALEAALAHSWPGNVRELRNRVQRGLSLGDGPLLMPGDLFPDLAPMMAVGMREGLEGVRDEAERRYIVRVLAENGGAVQATAKVLGVSRTTLWEKMRRHGIPAPAS
ncbi:sigma-54 dependent transcriptional regulator [Bosea sp. (in: a-proteobacteria)]|uniref:sigma-54-dependent transcriptional regulator n=1 Tax=Bosea sp. (in: a-proteobacteria) TaxID=1871050 RepID=UPI0027342801|nr:sigma-54 dependent transcriptional regulator [Bosea sp. (in: a-proteobacteria)]MDP3258577.1 sigma-54 dependent transcriptional regulator [Bosea sp. (in: a-proteobacteria)]